MLSSGQPDAEPPVEIPAEDDEYVRAVRDLRLGSWIEFSDETGSRERAKLSWISPISSKYLFVNRRGLKVCDKTVAALAIEMRRGSAVVLEEVPLFDRALDAIVARLRHASDAAKTPQPANPAAPQCNARRADNSGSCRGRSVELKHRGTRPCYSACPDIPASHPARDPTACAFTAARYDRTRRPSRT